MEKTETYGKIKTNVSVRESEQWERDGVKGPKKRQRRKEEWENDEQRQRDLKCRLCLL